MVLTHKLRPALLSPLLLPVVLPPIVLLLLPPC
jgi:hypothetical protein